MTTIAVLVDPPRPGLVLPRLVETSPLSEQEAADLYAAIFRDLVEAVEKSGGELLVNYRADDDLPGDGDSEAELREALADANVDDPRFEVQVGESFAARAGNTITHLLEGEEVNSAAVVRPNAPFLTRQFIDEAAMKLRRSEVVLGPATESRVHYAGFTDTIDFTGAYAAPALETLTDRAVDVGYGVDFLPMVTALETGHDLANVLSLVNTRKRAGRLVPGHTASVLDTFELVVESTAEGLAVSR